MGQQMKGKASKESKERNRRFFPVQISSTWGDLQRDVSVKMDAKTLSQILDFMI
jgi:ribosomal protein L28